MTQAVDRPEHQDDKSTHVILPSCINRTSEPISLFDLIVTQQAAADDKQTVEFDIEFGEHSAPLAESGTL